MQKIANHVLKNQLNLKNRYREIYEIPCVMYLTLAMYVLRIVIDQFFVFCSLEQPLHGLLDAQLSQKFQSFFDRYLTIYYILIYL